MLFTLGFCLREGNDRGSVTKCIAPKGLSLVSSELVILRELATICKDDSAALEPEKKNRTCTQNTSRHSFGDRNTCIWENVDGWRVVIALED